MTSLTPMSSRKPPVCQSTFGFPDDPPRPLGSAPCARAHKPFPVLCSVPRVSFGRARERSSNSQFCFLSPKPSTPSTTRFPSCLSTRAGKNLPARLGLPSPPGTIPQPADSTLPSPLVPPQLSTRNLTSETSSLRPLRPLFEAFSPHPLCPLCLGGENCPPPKNVEKLSFHPRTTIREANVYSGETNLWRAWEAHPERPANQNNFFHPRFSTLSPVQTVPLPPLFSSPLRSLRPSRESKKRHAILQSVPPSLCQNVPLQNVEKLSFGPLSTACTANRNFLFRAISSQLLSHFQHYA